nr:hypothetical protein [Angustibacter aerolatus]
MLATHVLTVTTSKPGAAPDLTKAKAHWVDRRTIAWPADGLPAGTRPEQVSWRLHWSATGGLAVDDEALTGGSSARLTYDPDGLPASVVKKYPQARGVPRPEARLEDGAPGGDDPARAGGGGAVRRPRPAARRHRGAGAGGAGRPVLEGRDEAALRRRLVGRPSDVPRLGPHGEERAPEGVAHDRCGATGLHAA